MNDRESSQQPTPTFHQAIRWVVAAKYGTIAARVVIALVMARILAPAMFGVIEMAYTFFGLARVIRGLSLGDVIVQRHDVDHLLLSSIYWLNLVVCSIATVVLLTLSPIAGYFYSNPQVTAVTAALSFAFILESMALVPSSLLKKEMDFRSIALREAWEVTVMGVVVVTLGKLGFGVWAIVIATLVSLVARNIALSLVKPFFPQFAIDWPRTKECFGFGATLSLNALLSYLRRNLDKVLIGSILGAASLGLYGLAHKLILMPQEAVIEVVNRAVLPRFSRSKHDRTELADLYLRAVSAIALLILPALALIAVLADLLVPVLLGEQWLGVAPIVQLLAPASAFLAISSTRNRLLVAIGEAKLILKVNFYRFLLHSMAIALAVNWGLVALAAAVLVASIIAWPIENRVCFRNWPALSIVSHLRWLVAPLLGTSSASAVAYCCKRLLIAHELSDSIALVAASSAALAVYFIVVRQLGALALRDVAQVLPVRYRRILVPASG